MVIELNTKVSMGETFGKKLGNLILEDAKFFGRPNFAGEKDQFNEEKRKFTVLIPNDLADQLREMGWNVKTSIPTDEQVAEGWEPVSHLKVVVDINDDPGKGAQVFIKQGEDVEKLNSGTVALVDRSRFELMDMEIRAWEYNPAEKPGEYSARLVKFVGVLRPSILDAKHGRLS